MSEEKTEVTVTPLKKGELNISTKQSERKELPNGTIFQAHATEVGIVDFGEGDRLELTFVIDDGELKGETFKKWFNPGAAGPKAGIVKLAQAVLGATLPEVFDPTILTGKPIQVIFSPDTFNGKDIQVASYLPPVAGQKISKTEEITFDTLDEVFGGVEEVK